MNQFTPPKPPPKVQLSPCRPSCCRTPYFCAKQRACACHETEDKQ